MASNFDFLQPRWTALFDDARQSERRTLTEPRTSAFYARRALEAAVTWMYANDGALHLPYQDNLNALLHEPTFRQSMPPSIWDAARFIQKLGNLAAHSNSNLLDHEALQVVRSLHGFLTWMARTYTPGGATVAAFAEGLVPTPEALIARRDKNREELQNLQASLKEKDEALAATSAALQQTKEELEAHRAQVAAVKQANAKSAATGDYSEAETRDVFIDVMLREAGWDPHGDRVREFPVVGMPNPSGKGKVDYLLWDDDGEPLAVVEAKQTKIDAKKGQQQALLYADSLEAMTGRRPVIYYTNGYETTIWDDAFYPPRQVAGFHTKDELRRLIERRGARDSLTQTPTDEAIAGRYYQKEAIQRVAEEWQDKRQRKALLVMATGTGKTRVAAAMVKRLMAAGWIRRVLFLADRKALVRQAKNAFAAAMPNVPMVNLLEKTEDAGTRIVFSSYPTMLNLIDEAKVDGERRFGVGYFDLVIVDEAHRSVYAKYGAIFEYFDSLLLGLTATPVSHVDRNTFDLFGLAGGEPTFAYELDQAVEDECLVPPRAFSMPCTLLRRGIKYDDLPPEEKAEYEEKFYDEETGEMPDEIDAAALNAWLFNSDTVDGVLEKLMEKGQKVEGGDRIGKTIIFAANKRHADFVVERFDTMYPHLAGKTARAVYDGQKYVESIIENFSKAKKEPSVAASVDMLDTGVDIPEVVNLVFFKRVRSYAKFWQMIGRGTRLCPDLFGPGEDKKNFTILDFLENFEYFDVNPAGIDGTVQESVKTKVFRQRLAILQRLQGVVLNDEQTAWRGELIDALHGEVVKMNPNNFIVRPQRMYVERFSDRARWDDLSGIDWNDLHTRIAPLPTPDQDDETARRFDLITLNLQLSMLNETKAQVGLQERMRDIAKGLQGKKSIPIVASQMDLIEAMQRDAWWQERTPPSLEDVRRRLRNLVQFVEWEGGRDPVYSGFTDEVGEGVELSGIVKPQAGLEVYRRKVQSFIRDHQSHPTIVRLKNNQPLSKQDLDALESLLFGPEGAVTREQYAEAYGSRQPLARLVRQTVGMSRQAVMATFTSFLEQGSLTADQREFVRQIVNYLCRNGVMSAEALFEEPFTDTHPAGLAGVFPKDADVLVSLIESVNRNAEVF